MDFTLGIISSQHFNYRLPLLFNHPTPTIINFYTKLPILTSPFSFRYPYCYSYGFLTTGFLTTVGFCPGRDKIQPPVFLSAFARCHGGKAVDECEQWITRSGSAGWCVGGFRRSNGGYHGRPSTSSGWWAKSNHKPVVASFFSVL